MSSPSSYRIGRRTTAAAGNSSESEVLRSLFELRKHCNYDSISTSAQQETELTFWNCQWTQRIVNSLRKLIARDGRCFSTIKFFDCGFNNPEFTEIVSMILSHNSTTKLVIKKRKPAGSRNDNNAPRCESSTASSSFDDTFLAAIRDGISTNTNLKYLKLSGLNFANGKGTSIPNASMENNDNTNDTVHSDEHLWCHSLIKNDSLLHLDLSDSYLSKSTISCLSSAVAQNTALQSLNFSRCRLDDQSLSQILRSVKEHPNLTKLDLSRNLFAKSTSTIALDAVAELLTSSDCKLECLDLSNQQVPATRRVIADVDVDLEESEIEERHKVAFKNAFDALSTNETLRSINLSGNGGCFLDLDSVKALSSCLVANTGLSHVDVSSCHLTPVGISYLAQNCVPRCGGQLKTLVLFDDEISNDSVDNNEWATAFASLEKGLQRNSTLESLGDLDNIVGMNLESKKSLQYLLNVNRAGRRALQADDLPVAAWANIFARANRIEYDNGNNEDCISTVTSASVLFTLLHGPVMLEQRR